MHFPISFLALSYGIDILNTLSPRLPKSITSNLAPSADLTRASYYLLSIGLITAIPALVTGIREAVMLISKQGMYESSNMYGKVMRTKVKAMIAHAVANDIVMAVSAYIWYSKRAAAKNTLAGKMGLGTASTAAAAYAPAMWMVVAEAAVFVLLMVAANIGGSLTYIFGIGFSAGGGSNKKTQ